MSAPVTRIFSDLHYRDGASSLQRLADLRPLFEGADRIVLNGDTVDTQARPGKALLEEARAFFSSEAPPTTFLSGNHDPDISPDGELVLGAGRVWVTHGDVLFEDIAPWSELREEIRRRLRQCAAEHAPEALRRLETRLQVHRAACHGLPQKHDQFDRRLVTRARRLACIATRPGRLIRMLDAWLTTPARARRLARDHRPDARVVIVGHTHRPGVWRGRCGVTVVNTGSFCRPFGGLCVDLRGHHVEVVQVEREGQAFRRGRVVSRFSLAP